MLVGLKSMTGTLVCLVLMGKLSILDITLRVDFLSI